MKQVQIQALTVESFAPFGTFASVDAPSGPSLSGEFHTFYRDSSRYFSNFGLPIGFSPLTVRSHGFIVDALEFHSLCCEAIMPVNDDAVLHVTPAGGAPDLEATRAFLVPKGTIVTLFPGVYHLTPLPREADELNALIVLPERAYANDFTLVELAQSFEIVL